MEKYYISERYKTYAPNVAINLAEKAIKILNEIEINADVVYNIERVVLEFTNDDFYRFDNQWEIIMAYCSPKNANYKKAVDLLIEDINMLIEKVEE